MSSVKHIKIDYNYMHQNHYRETPANKPDHPEEKDNQHMCVFYLFESHVQRTSFMNRE